MNQNTENALPQSLDEDRRPSDDLSAFHDLAVRIISILSFVIKSAMIAFIILVVAYVGSLYVAVDQPSAQHEVATAQIESLFLKLWDRVLPIGQTIITILAPILVLLLAIVAATKLTRHGVMLGSAPIHWDLSSVLALLIVSTICLLPLAGVTVPDVLGNVALVVVGFYFGKKGREKSDTP